MRVDESRLRRIIRVTIREVLTEKAYGGAEPDYQNMTRAQAKKTYSTIKKKYGPSFKGMLKAFDWADDPAAALATLEKKATGRWPSEG